MLIKVFFYQCDQCDYRCGSRSSFKEHPAEHKWSGTPVINAIAWQHKLAAPIRMRNQNIRAPILSVINATTWLLDKITRTSTRKSNTGMKYFIVYCKQF